MTYYLKRLTTKLFRLRRGAEQPDTETHALIDMSMTYQCLFEHKKSLSINLNTSLLKVLTASTSDGGKLDDMLTQSTKDSFNPTAEDKA